ncbi:hypothetical protein ACRALDRAFT_211653 [Sodiomyces alcalophilus JCM 7366]|uniref:uncharacterized protein n=1 Tax=Sodiomyces alcalophilus JCM 7366 TaxID=591952 RepID=UPI0039B38CF6
MSRPSPLQITYAQRPFVTRLACRLAHRYPDDDVNNTNPKQNYRKGNKAKSFSRQLYGPAVVIMRGFMKPSSLQPARQDSGGVLAYPPSAYCSRSKRLSWRLSHDEQYLKHSRKSILQIMSHQYAEEPGAWRSTYNPYLSMIKPLYGRNPDDGILKCIKPSRINLGHMLRMRGAAAFTGGPSYRRPDERVGRCHLNYESLRLFIITSHIISSPTPKPIPLLPVHTSLLTR